MESPPEQRSNPPAPKAIFRFGLFELDGAAGTLRRGGAPVKIQEQPFRVLLALLEHPGQIVAREELRQELWPEGTYVDFDGSLNVILKKLRAAIGDDPNHPRFIETIPRKGYRFIAPMERRAGGASDARAPGRAAFGTVGRVLARFGWSASRASAGADNRRNVLWYSAAAVLVILMALLWVRSRFGGGKRPAEVSSVVYAEGNSVAVVPFANWRGDANLDYLRFAIASDIVTDLTYARSISVRPFASTMKYGDHAADPATVGREMRASYVVSGYFVNEKNQLTVTAELTRTADDRVVWRDTFSAAPNELVHLHNDLAWSLQKGVIGALGSGEMAGDIPVPSNPRAYDLYLRSVAIPRDPKPNHEAIGNLEESVKEDPNYAPAWEELGWRLYLDAEYGSGGEAAYRKSEEASERAASLDPNGTANWTAVRVEHGDLQGAYDLTRALVTRRPDSSEAHFEMAYVYRYAGLLDRSATECNAALAIDPGNVTLRSCSKVFMYLGDYRQAGVFVDLDGSSGWSVRQRMHFALRRKQNAEALALATIAVQSGYSDSEIVEARLQGQSAAALDAVAEKEERYADRESDPEEKYEVAAMLSFAGQADRAIRILKAAIERNYCAAPLLESDPLLGGLRNRLDFQKLRDEAAACQRRFLEHATRAAETELQPKSASGKVH